MRIAYVVSDLTVPPREGLHEQSLLLARELAKSEEVELFGFVRDRKLRAQLVEDLLHITVPLKFVNYFGPSAVFGASVAPLAGKPIMHYINAGDYDAVILEGPAAASLACKLSDTRMIVNWVDPGVLRFERLWRFARSPKMKLQSLFALHVYAYLERRVSSSPAHWTFVSEPDTRYMRSRYPNLAISHLPIIMAPSEGRLSTSFGSLHGPQDVRSRSTERDRLRVLLYIDGRTAHGKRGIRQAISELAQVDQIKLDIVVMARLSGLDRLKHSDSIELYFISWADDPIWELSSADLVLLPDLFGTGIKNRSIQAIRHAKRLLATTTALEGIGISSEAHLRIAYEVGHLSSAVIEVACNINDRGNKTDATDALDAFEPSSVRAKWLNLLTNRAADRRRVD